MIGGSLYDFQKDDLKKYDDSNHEKASVIFKTIPEQLTNRNARFRLSLIDKNARYRNYVEAVDSVAESQMGNVCVNVTAPEVALELFADRGNFKLYMGDTGLLITKGLFFHEYAYRPERAQTEKKYEIDFLLVKNRSLCPLEVKSSGYKNHKSFDYFIKKYQLKVNERYIIYTKDLQVEDGVTYLPVYMTMFL